jgi:cation transport ATPase
VVAAAGAVEADSGPPIGRAVTATARQRTGALPDAVGLQALAGRGARAEAGTGVGRSAGASAWPMLAAPYGW